MILNGKTMLALDALQIQVVLQALHQYHGPYDKPVGSLDSVEQQRHRNMIAEAGKIASEIEEAVTPGYAQD